MGESTAVQCFKEFSICVLECFAPTYLRAFNKKKTIILSQRAESLEFPGTLGSIDCSKWK